MKKIFSLLTLMLIFSACSKNEIPTVEIADYTSRATADANGAVGEYTAYISADDNCTVTINIE